MIISVGYRVKSKRGVEFRRRANNVLKQYVMQGYAVNQKRLSDLGSVVKLLKRTENSLDAKQVLTVVERYSTALDLLDSYDPQSLQRPKGNSATYHLTYEECRQVIDSMRFGEESDLFGLEKDDSFKGSIGNIYQSFAGKEIYPSLEEKAANLLYFVTKDHSFADGNKRIAATMFLYFLDKKWYPFCRWRKTDRRPHACRVDNYDRGIQTRRKRNHDRCDHELHCLKRNNYWVVHIDYSSII